jgi:DNA-binding MarR family transcriptional regulator
VTAPPDRAARQAATLDAVLELSVLLADDMARDLPRRGLTRSRAEVVWRVHHQGPMTQRALADALGVSARNVTGLVDGLESTGFVVRRPDPDDRRAIRVTLTDAGRTAAETLGRDFVELAEQLFGELTDERLDAFADALAEVVGRLRVLAAGADAGADAGAGAG